MRTRTKLVILELICGIFGWIWLLSGVAALYFAAAAVFSNSPWSRFFWAVGASVVAKWLAKGINDNKTRVAFIAAMMERGLSREQATQEWLDRYLGNKS